MKKELQIEQSKIHELFDVMRVLEEVEWIDSQSDDHYPNVCPWCGGYQEYRHNRSLEGHRSSCVFVKCIGSLFYQAVSIASEMQDGNLFLNLVVGLHLGKPRPRFG